jgi:adenylate cyclase
MTSRRLAAIVVVDVAGYSRMMAEDEEGTLAALKAHRNETDPIVLNHGGRIVKGTGDGVLVEFPSAVEAVNAAVEAQRLMAERNGALARDRRMEYRIGINLGDVIVDDDGDIYGDGVNIAARLEGRADAGGICVADAVYRQVSGRLEVAFEDLGPIEVKNIPEPVRAWRVATADIATTPESVATSRYALPSVAVLPFVNMSGDADQEYFADGLTEGLTTALSRHRDIKVVSGARTRRCITSASSSPHARALPRRTSSGMSSGETRLTSSCIAVGW